MKKQCTSNKAITIDASIACASTATVTPTCTNPISYLLKEASNVAYANGILMSDALANLLNSGIYITNPDKFCCPNCDDIYFLGFFEAFTNSLTSLIPNMTCCYNYVGSASVLNQYPTIGALACCNTNFSDCVAAVNENAYAEDLTFFGSLLEYNTINNESSLCVLYDALLAYSSADIVTEMATVLGYGIVVKCIDCKLFIGSAATYYNLFID